jgi:hypothetical protein
MRPFYYLPLLAVFAACDSGVDVSPGIVQWMEWPAEVAVATPFTVRLLVPFPGCSRGDFKPGVSADESAVTFAPYFVVHTKGYCPPTAQTIDLPYWALDTVGTAPGLASSFARSFEMRAAASVYAPSPNPGYNDQPVRTFGEVTVRLAGPDLSRRNAAGYAYLIVDNSGCVRLQPLGYHLGDAGFILEDQADTTGPVSAFVRGYIHQAATPVCGQTRVFHVVSRN